jgi:hypothetical protein
MVQAQRAKIPPGQGAARPLRRSRLDGKHPALQRTELRSFSYRSVSAMQMLPAQGSATCAARSPLGKPTPASGTWRPSGVVSQLISKLPITTTGTTTTLRTAQRNRDLLTRPSQISEVRYRLGKGMQADVLRSQVEVSMLQQKLTTLEQMSRRCTWTTSGRCSRFSPSTAPTCWRPRRST